MKTITLFLHVDFDTLIHLFNYNFLDFLKKIYSPRICILMNKNKISMLKIVLLLNWFLFEKSI